MRLSDIMNPRVVTIDLEASAQSAWQKMDDENIYHLVVTRGKSVVGILSHRDLGGARGEAMRQGKLVAELMQPQIISAHPDTSLREAANLLRGESIGCLPILDEHEVLVGIMTVTDLLDLLGQGTVRITTAADRRPERNVPVSEKLSPH
ncbi:MAG: CBS domain-containing protein [Vampirovibrionales bacterium]|nr:CBS domain-containing protein [Vampirovibrionales bacterium]